jgi:SNF2 family DNA or RNA helicase
MTVAKHFTPRPYQHLMVDHIIKTPRCALWVNMGMGKSAATLLALDILDLVEDVYPALVIAPLRVAQSTWPEEVAKWERFNRLRLCAVVGNEQERRSALRNAADIYTINYENLPWLQDTLGDNWPFKTVVADESTKLKGFRLRQGTKRAKALAKVAHTKVTRFINLTGTPSPNGLADLWGQTWYLDAGQRLGRTFDAFRQRWFQKSFDGYSIEPLAHAQGEIQERLKDICLSLNAADYFDLREPIVNTIYVDLEGKAKELYDDMEKRMFMELLEAVHIEQYQYAPGLFGETEVIHEVEAFNAAARTMKCLQLANGAAYVGEDNSKWVEVHDAKIKALEDIIEEAAGMPVLVAYHFRSDLARLQKAFPRGRALDKQPETIRDWNAGRIPVLFAHPASAGHGLSLQDGGNIIAFFGHSWNLEEYMQIIERIGPTRQMQSGYDRPVFIHHIVARNTVEELVIQRLNTKREVQDILLEAMKQRGLATC